MKKALPENPPYNDSNDDPRAVPTPKDDKCLMCTTIFLEALPLAVTNLSGCLTSA